MGIYSLRTNFATHMKVVLWVVIVIFVIGALWSFGAAPMMKKAKQKEVVMVVANNNVPRSDFDAEWERIYKIAQQNGIKSPLEFANLKQMILENMINSQKLVNVAAGEGIIITKKDIKAAKEERILEVLKQSRNAIIGDLDEKREAIDPRKDKEFLKTLSDNGMSIDSIVSEADANVSDLSVKAELVQKKITEKADAKAANLTSDEVKASYKNYTIEQIVISEDKTTATEAKSNADKAYAELQKGADFAKVKAKYSTINSFPSMDYNPIDMPWSIPAKVGASVKNLKEGGYTEVIESNKAYYIVKVTKITDKAPKDLGVKVVNERKEQIKQAYEQEAFVTIQEKMDAIKEINVKDPEFNGYYHCILAEKELTNEGKKGEYTKAIQFFTEALKKDELMGKDVINAKLAKIYYDTEDYKAAKEALYNLMDGPNSTCEAYDLRALYGDTLVKLEEKDKAIEQYKEAALLNKIDPNFLDDIATKLSDLGAKADAKIARDQANKIKAAEAKQQADMMKKK